VRNPDRVASFVGNNVFLLLLTAITCTYGMFWSDRLPANGGLGWDGGIYAKFVQKLDTPYLKELGEARVAKAGAIVGHTQPVSRPAPTRGLAPYFFHRLAPVVFVHLVLQLFHIEHSNHNIILAFLWLNAIALMIATALWTKIMDVVGIRGYTKLVGYCALFFNFASMKMPFYYPVMMDTASFLVAMVLLFFYVTRRQAALWLAALVGAFTHPYLFYVGVVLFLVPYESTEAEQTGWPSAATSVRLDRVVGWGIILLVGVVPWIAAAVNLLRLTEAERQMSALKIGLLVLGCALVVAYLRLALGPLINVRRGLGLVRRLLARERTKLIVVAASFLAIELGIRVLAVGKSVSAVHQLTMMAWSCIALPLVFVVAHVWYFGPVFLLYILRWRDVVTAIKSLGTGLALVAVLQFILLLDSESRREIVLLPFVGLFLVKAINLRRFRPPFYWMLVFLSLAFSRVWLPLKIDAPWTGPDFDPFAFPWQWFFMNLGPWLIDRVYVIGTAILLVAMIVIWSAGTWFTGGVEGEMDDVPTTGDPR